MINKEQAKDFLTVLMAMPDEDLAKEQETIIELLESSVTEESIKQKIREMEALGQTVEELEIETETLRNSFLDERSGLSPIKLSFLNKLLEMSIELNDAVVSIGNRPKVKVFIEKVHNDAVIPTYARRGDAGADIYSIEDMIIPAGTTKIVKTGLKVAIPYGYEWQVRPRSGFTLDESNQNILIPNSPGTVDCGYRKEVGIIMRNIGTNPYAITKGERIAQVVLVRSPEAVFQEVEDVSTIGTNRGGGFGHTGK